MPRPSCTSATHLASSSASRIGAVCTPGPTSPMVRAYHEGGVNGPATGAEARKAPRRFQTTMVGRSRPPALWAPQGRRRHPPRSRDLPARRREPRRERPGRLRHRAPGSGEHRLHPRPSVRTPRADHGDALRPRRRRPGGGGLRDCRSWAGLTAGVGGQSRRDFGTSVVWRALRRAILIRCGPGFLVRRDDSAWGGTSCEGCACNPADVSAGAGYNDSLG
jgi:hypothetical protein